MSLLSFPLENLWIIHKKEPRIELGKNVGSIVTMIIKGTPSLEINNSSVM